MTDKPKLTITWLTDAEMRAIDEGTPHESTASYARVPTKTKGWPRVRRGRVEWQCALCDEWCAGSEDEHQCTPGNKA
jgi:hypothetical protein